MSRSALSPDFSRSASRPSTLDESATRADTTLARSGPLAPAARSVWKSGAVKTSSSPVMPIERIEKAA